MVQSSVHFRPLTGLMLNTAATMIDSKVTGDYRNGESRRALWVPNPPPIRRVRGVDDRVLWREHQRVAFHLHPKVESTRGRSVHFPVARTGTPLSAPTSSIAVRHLRPLRAPLTATPRSEAYTTASDYELPSYPLLDLRLGFETTDGKVPRAVLGTKRHQ